MPYPGGFVNKLHFFFMEKEKKNRLSEKRIKGKGSSMPNFYPLSNQKVIMYRHPL
jgi:hypothetical protein